MCATKSSPTLEGFYVTFEECCQQQTTNPKKKHTTKAKNKQQNQEKNVKIETEEEVEGTE